MWSSADKPPQRTGAWLVFLWGVCCLVIALTVFSSFVKPLGLYDEGFTLTNAWRILDGDIPHRDYWSAYPLGTAYTVAIAFLLTEPTLLVARIVSSLWTVLLLLSFFSILRNFLPTSQALFTTVLSSLWISEGLYPSYSVTPALALALLSLSLLFNSLKALSRVTAAAGGVFAGSILLFRHDFAAYLFLSLLIAIAVCRLLRTPSRDNPGLRVSLVFAALFAVTATLFLCLILAYCGWEDFYQQAILFPATGMRENRVLPVPGFFDFFRSWKTLWVLAWAAPIGMLLGGLNVAASRQEIDFPGRMCLLIFLSMAILLTLQARNRLDFPHAVPSILFAWCFFLISWRLPARNLGSMKKRFGMVACSGFIFLTLATTVSTANTLRAVQCLPSLHSSSCLAIDESQLEVVRYIERNTRPSEHVFIGNTRHDKIFINDASLYFLLRRPIPVKWNEMHPGVVTTAAVQEEITRSLDNNHVHFVVIADLPESTENNSSSVSSGVFLLDKFIRDKYFPVFSNGKYTVLQSREPRTYSPG